VKYYEVEHVEGGKRQFVKLYAENKTKAIQKAKVELGLKPLRARELGLPLFENLVNIKAHIESLFSKGRLDPRELLPSIGQIAVMANAGISFTQTLTEVINSSENPKIKEIFTAALIDINAGLSFSESLRKRENEVGKLFVTMVELGEKTGQLAESMTTLGLIVEEIVQNKEKIKKALRYPIITLSAISIAFVILMLLVVPKFEKIFAKFKTELPWPTKFLLASEKFLSNYGLLSLAVIVGIFFGLGYLYRTNKKFKYLFDKSLLKFWIVGEVVRLGLLSRFTLVFKELNNAGLPIIEALSISIASIENEYMKSKLITSISSIQRGLSFTVAINEAGMYDSMAIQMISAGEQSGALTQMLEKISEYYKQRFQGKVDGLSAAIEPVLMALTAGIVLLLALGIFMPLWDMSKAIQKVR
jgi:general secretion pathway protein F